jgi:uncharacterized protein
VTAENRDPGRGADPCGRDARVPRGEAGGDVPSGRDAPVSRDLPRAEVEIWEGRCRAFVEREFPVAGDAAHDLQHVERVVENARRLAAAEGAEIGIVLPAAWLHDCVIVPKHSPEQASASRLAADSAATFLRGIGFPEALVPDVHHAIHAHSFSARVPPQTLEARVVQDADRLDALGAVGIARTLMLGGAMGIPLYDPAEPFPRRRRPADREFVIDHFFTKLLTLEATMGTEAGRLEAARRTELIRNYLDELEREIGR